MVEAAPDATARSCDTYLVLGVEHILGGIDHLLFVLALLILVQATGAARRDGHGVHGRAQHHARARRRSASCTCRGRRSKPSIALSIVFVAGGDRAQPAQGKPRAHRARCRGSSRSTFGLLHGFGFAGALSEVGLPQSAIPVALLFFNVGVELGQLLFIAAVLAVIALARQVTRRLRASRPAWAWRVPPYAIGTVAAFWVIQRTVSFF